MQVSCQLFIFGNQIKECNPLYCKELEKSIYFLKRELFFLCHFNTISLNFKKTASIQYIFLNIPLFIFFPCPFFIYFVSLKYQNTIKELCTNMKVIPLADRVLVKTEKTESKTASGIIIPETAQEKTQIAVVLAVGDDTEKIKVAVGDRVMYDKYAGTQVTIDNEECLILKGQDIIAKIA